MNAQTNLFDAPITRGSARKTDPHTSQAARDVVKVGPRQAECLAALEAAGGRGTVDTVMHAFPRRLRNSMSKRLSELDEMGLIRKTGESVIGDFDAPVTVWEIVR